MKGIGDQEDCLTIVRAVIGLGRSLHMAVNAEGVETQGQLNALRSEGCSEIQGYFYSKPVPVEGVRNLLQTHGNATLAVPDRQQPGQPATPIQTMIAAE